MSDCVGLFCDVCAFSTAGTKKIGKILKKRRRRRALCFLGPTFDPLSRGVAKQTKEERRWLCRNLGQVWPKLGSLSLSLATSASVFRQNLRPRRQSRARDKRSHRNAKRRLIGGIGGVGGGVTGVRHVAGHLVDLLFDDVDHSIRQRCFSSVSFRSFLRFRRRFFKIIFSRRRLARRTRNRRLPLVGGGRTEGRSGQWPLAAVSDFTTRRRPTFHWTTNLFPDTLSRYGRGAQHCDAQGY